MEKITAYQEKFGKVVRRIVAPAIELSSSEVREAIAKGQPIDGMVPPSVARYVNENHLYRNV